MSGRLHVIASRLGAAALALLGDKSVARSIQAERTIASEAIAKAIRIRDIWRKDMADSATIIAGLRGERDAALVAAQEYERLYQASKAQAGQTRVGVATIVRKENGEVLWGLRTSKHGGGTWSIPGGAVDPREHPSFAALRELEEETGISPAQATSLRPAVGLPVWTYNDSNEPQPPWVTLYYLVEVPNDTVALVMEPTKCAEWVWRARGDLPAPMFGPMQACLNLGIDPWTVEVAAENGVAIARNLDRGRCMVEATQAAAAVEAAREAFERVKGQPGPRGRSARVSAGERLRKATERLAEAEARLARAGGRVGDTPA